MVLVNAWIYRRLGVRHQVVVHSIMLVVRIKQSLLGLGRSVRVGMRAGSNSLLCMSLMVIESGSGLLVYDAASTIASHDNNLLVSVHVRGVMVLARRLVGDGLLLQR